MSEKNVNSKKKDDKMNECESSFGMIGKLPFFLP